MLSCSTLAMKPSVSSWARCGPALSQSTGEPAAAGWPEGGSGARGRGKGRDRSAAKGAVLCPQTPRRSPAEGWETREGKRERRGAVEEFEGGFSHLGSRRVSAGSPHQGRDESGHRPGARRLQSATSRACAVTIATKGNVGGFAYTRAHGGARRPTARRGS